MDSRPSQSHWDQMVDQVNPVTTTTPSKRTYPGEFVNQINSSRPKRGKATDPPDNSKEFHLELLTQPLQCIATEWTDDKKPRSHKKRDPTRWPLEPPPVLAFRIAQGCDLSDYNNLACCPNVFCVATLCDKDGVPVSSEIMRGRHSSSLFKLEREKSPKIPSNSPTMGVFLFDQIHVRWPGEYRLLFTLFEMQLHDQGMHAVVHNVIQSDKFVVLPQPKKLPKAEDPPEILKALMAQGAKLKIRKPSDEKSNKKKPDYSIDTGHADYYSQAVVVPTSISMGIPMPGHMMAQQNPLQASVNYGLPMLPITSSAFNMSMQAINQITPQQPSFQRADWMMPATEINFGCAPQDPTQTFMFGGPNSTQQQFGGPNFSQGSYSQPSHSQHSFSSLNHVQSGYAAHNAQQDEFAPANPPPSGFDGSDPSQHSYLPGFNNY